MAIEGISFLEFGHKPVPQTVYGTVTLCRVCLLTPVSCHVFLNYVSTEINLE